MIDKEFRKSLNEYGAEREQSILLFDCPSFDDSIVGVTDDGRLVYDYWKMVNELMHDDDISETDSIEFIETNTIRSLAYQKMDQLLSALQKNLLKIFIKPIDKQQILWYNTKYKEHKFVSIK